jgi:hypothetical protein
MKSAAPGRVFVTNSKGQVVLDITRERGKPVRSNIGFEEKRPPTTQELKLIKLLWNETK